MSSILAYAVKAIAEGKLGELPKKLYWALAGKKMYIGMAFGAAWAVLDWGTLSGTCGKLGYDCTAWANTLGTIAASLLAFGLYDGALRTKAPNKLAGLVLLLCLGLSLSACGSMAQVRVGGEPRMHPDEQVVFARVCADQPDAARLYLESPTFAWIGPVKERYLTDALMRKLAGDCPCPGKTCPKLEGSK